MSKIIAPSILSANFARLGEEVNSVLDAGADWIHFDVMDNHYVPNLTIGPMVCKALRDHGVTAPIDVHLMVQPVDALYGPAWQIALDLREVGLDTVKALSAMVLAGPFMCGFTQTINDW